MAGNIPSVTVTSEGEIIFVTDDCITMNLTCTADVDPFPTLVWVQGEKDPQLIPDQYTSLNTTLESRVLTLDSSTNCEYLTVTEEGLSLYCLANTSLGIVRSRAVILMKPCELVVKISMISLA